MQSWVMSCVVSCLRLLSQVLPKSQKLIWQWYSTSLFCIIFLLPPSSVYYTFFLLHSWLLTLQTGIQFHYNFATSTQHICNNNRKKTIKCIEGNCSVMIFCQLHFLFMILYPTFRYVFTVFRVIHSKLCSTCVFERILETKRTTNNRGERSPNWDLFWHPLFIFSHQD